MEGLSNAQIAELLARTSEKAEGHWARALRKAARAALAWPEEAAWLHARRRSLTELPRVGPKLAELLGEWLGAPPEVPASPDTRAGFSTFAQARAVVSNHPDWARGLRGDLQMHTLHSDGAASVEGMARAGLELGYEYMAITDHSKGLKIARGLDEHDLLLQGEEIDAVNEDLAGAGRPLRMLRSLEMNLAPDGSGDMDFAALRGLDLVLGSFHSQLRVKEDQTERYLAALRHPCVHVLAHPRGRIYNFRRGLQADWSRVFDEAARLDKALEIDCYPDRQDLDLERLEKARDADVRISIGTDSHTLDELAFMPLGLAAAIKAGVRRERILNFLPGDALLEWADEVGNRC